MPADEGHAPSYRAGGGYAAADAERQRYRDMFIFAPTALLITDSIGTIREANHAAAWLLGVPPHLLEGAPLVGFADPDGRHILKRALARLRRGQPVADCRIRVQPRGSAALMVAAAATPLADTGSGPGIFQWQVQEINITGERLAEEERDQLLAREQAARADAEAAQQRLAFLAEASVLLAGSLDDEHTLSSRVARLALPHLADLCLVDIVEEHGEVRCTAVSHAEPAKERLLDELRRRYPDDPYHGGPVSHVLRTGEPEFYLEISDAMLQAAATGDPEHLRLLREIVVSGGMYVPLVARGHTLGVISLLSTTPGHHYTLADLSLALELARRAAIAVDNARLYRDAQEALRLRDHFLSAAAHELKTPLTTIRGLAQTLSRWLRRGGGIETSLFTGGLVSINDATTHMAELVERLLDVTRLQTGRPLPLCLEPVDLVALVRQVATEYERGVEHHHVRVEAREPVIVGRWDETRLRRVLSELIGNAVKFSADEVNITLTREEDGRHAVVRVRDEGAGIPAADLPHIFQPFYRGGNMPSYIQGTGIGLWDARRIVEMHGGAISAESAEGRGATFTVQLPL